MKGTSKVIMGATLVMAASLAIVSGLILVLLAELNCSLLLRRCQHKDSSAASSTVGITATAITPTNSTSPLPPRDNRDQSTSPLSSVYAQGVLHAPSNLLFPAQLTSQHRVLEVHNQEPNISPRQIGILNPTSTSASFVTSPPNPVQEISIQVGTGSTATTCKEKARTTAPGNGVENFVYISNPIYDSEAGKAVTQFETPGTSSSRFEQRGSSGDDDVEKAKASHVVRFYSPPMTPPLSPMKKLPAQANSTSLGDGRCLGNSGSDSISNNGLSSSSSRSPSTSPSW